MSNQTVSGSRWWLPVLAFAAGIAFHAVAPGSRAQTRTSEPAAVASASPNVESPAVIAQASSDTCEVQQD